MFKKIVSLAAFALACCLPFAAMAQAEGPWLVRARALYMLPTNGNSPELSLGKVEVDNKLFPEFDVVYFFTPNIAGELVLTYPQKHDVTLGGTEIGSVKHLPPTLLVQYHFQPTAEVRPYVGAGLNYTKFSSVQLPLGITLDSSSIGPALQAGFDWKIAPRWYFNADVKYVWIDTDVNAPTGRLLTLNIDPWLLSIGVGYRF